MPVYNGEAFLREALDSVLAQTFTDFEFIVVNDASRDASAAILREYADPRIRVLYNDTNLGLSASLNRGVDVSRGEIVARMDADDVCHHERFAKQIAYLDAHPRCGIVGSWSEIWRDSSRTDRAHRHPTDNVTLKYEGMFDSIFVHSSVMIRKSVFDKVGRYPVDRALSFPEDFALWSKAAREFDLANLAEPLIIYREVSSSVSRQRPASFMRNVSAICADNIAHAVGMSEADDTLHALGRYIHRVGDDVPSPARVMRWVAHLLRAGDALCDANGAPRGALRDRSMARARAVLSEYGRRVRAVAGAHRRRIQSSLARRVKKAFGT